MRMLATSCRASPVQVAAKLIQPVPLDHLPEQHDLELAGQPVRVAIRRHAGANQRMGQQGRHLLRPAIGLDGGGHSLKNTPCGCIDNGSPALSST